MSFIIKKGLLLSVVCLVILTVVRVMRCSLAAVLFWSGSGVGVCELRGAGFGVVVTFTAAGVEPALVVGGVLLRRDLTFRKPLSTSPSDSFESSEEAYSDELSK